MQARPAGVRADERLDGRRGGGALRPGDPQFEAALAIGAERGDGVVAQHRLARGRGVGHRPDVDPVAEGLADLAGQVRSGYGDRDPARLRIALQSQVAAEERGHHDQRDHHGLQPRAHRRGGRRLIRGGCTRRYRGGGDGRRGHGTAFWSGDGRLALCEATVVNITSMCSYSGRTTGLAPVVRHEAGVSARVPVS